MEGIRRMRLKENKSGFSSNISWLLAGKIYSMLIGMLSNILLVRYLGPELNGVYNYAIAYTAILNGISLMGLDNVLIKEFTKYIYNTNDIMISSIGIRLAGSFISIILLGISFWIFNVDFSQIVMIMIMALPFIPNAFSGISSWFYSQAQTIYIVISNAIAHTICVALKIILVCFKMDIISLLFATAIETYIIVGLEWLFAYKFSKNKYSKKIKRMSYRYQWETCKYLLFQGVPIIFGSIANTIFMKVDQLMVSSIIGDYELGIYSVAVHIAELWYYIPTTIVAVLLPNLTLLKEKNDGDFQKYLQRCMSLLVLIGYVSSAVTMIFSKTIIRILYGSEYIAASPILCIYIWAGVFINMSVLRGNYFVIMECTKYSLWCNAIGAVANVILNLILIPIIGCLGATVATLISYFLYAYLSSFIFKELHIVGKIQTKAFLLIGLGGK